MQLPLRRTLHRSALYSTRFFNQNYSGYLYSSIMSMRFVFLIIISFITFSATAQNKTAKMPDKNKELLTVDASCGQCKFGLNGKSCGLAVRINGQAYFVDGSHIDSHGDAHADDGFCNAIKKAQVQGEIVNNRFKASYFQILPDTAKKEK